MGAGPGAGCSAQGRSGCIPSWHSSQLWYRARFWATLEQCRGLAATHLEVPYQHGAWVSLRKGRGTRVGNGVIPARQLGGIWLQSRAALSGPERSGRPEIAFHGAALCRGRQHPSAHSRTLRSLMGGHRPLAPKIVLSVPSSRFNPGQISGQLALQHSRGDLALRQHLPRCSGPGPQEQHCLTCFELAPFSSYSIDFSPPPPPPLSHAYLSIP